VNEPQESHAPATRLHHSHRRTRSKSRKHRRIRAIYFGIASIWGFLIGSAALLWGLSLNGHPVRPDGLLTGLLIGAGFLALVGGVLTARAYREAAQRAQR
jgi:hypothetical protein